MNLSPFKIGSAAEGLVAARAVARRDALDTAAMHDPDKSSALMAGIGGYAMERSGLLTLAELVSPKLARKLDPALRPAAGSAGGAAAVDGAVQLGITADAPHQKVLIMTMGVTGGHNALAKAIATQIGRQYPDAQVHVANGAEISGEVFDSPIGNAMQKFHTYERADQPWIYDTRYKIRSTEGGTRGGRRLYDGMFRDDVKRVIDTHKPDVIVSTHPAVTATLGRMRSIGALNTPTVAALNDSAPNGLWLAPGIDQHVMYNPNDVQRLGRTFSGRPGQQLHMNVARPPIEQKLVTLEQQQALRTELGLPADRPVLVVASGSMGIPVRDETYARLLAETDAHVVVATGSNKQMQAHLAKTFPADRLTSLGFTNRMQDYLDASDGVMLKAHGMTFMEAVSANKPVVFFEPEGGHARGSVRALARDGYAMLAGSDGQLVAGVKTLGEHNTTLRLNANRASKELFAPAQSYADAVMHAKPQAAVVA